jgi:hypothetical protein
MLFLYLMNFFSTRPNITQVNVLAHRVSTWLKDRNMVSAAQNFLNVHTFSKTCHRNQKNDQTTDVSGLTGWKD